MHIVKATTEDGLRFTGFLSVPEKPTKKIIIHIHGMAGSPYEYDWYIDFHKLYPDHGYAFLAGQLRGTGEVTMFTNTSWEYPVKGDAFELFEECVYDIDAWVNYARSLGYEVIILQSHSFGPSKIFHYLCERPTNDIQAAILMSPVDMFAIAQMDKNCAVMSSEARSLMQKGRPKQILSNLLDGDTYLCAETFLNIFSLDSKANVFCYTSRKHDWGTVNAIQIPVLLIGGTNDGGMESVLHTKECFDILRPQLKNSPRIETKIYEGATHSFDGYSKEIVKDVVGFLSF